MILFYFFFPSILLRGLLFTEISWIMNNSSPGYFRVNFLPFFLFNSGVGSIIMKVLACSYRRKQGARAAVPPCWQLLLLVLLVLHGLETAVPWSDCFALITDFSVLRRGLQLHSSGRGFKSL